MGAARVGWPICLVAGLLVTASGCVNPPTGGPVVVNDPVPPAEIPGEIVPEAPDAGTIGEPTTPSRRTLRPACECGLS